VSNKVIQILVKAWDLSVPVLKNTQRNLLGVGSGVNKTLSSFRNYTTTSKQLATTQRDFNRVQRNTSGLLGAGAKAGAASAGVLFLLKRQLVDTGAQFETFNTLLEQAEGSSAKGRKAYAWIDQFSRKTPLQFQGVLDSYLKLKNFGLDPTNGSLKALVDTNSALGGDQQKLNGIILAVGQAWSKQKLQGEEALQLIERGVPVWQLLADATGKTTAQIQEMSAKGKLGTRAIQLLMDQMGKKNIGAAGKQMKTFNGMWSNLLDTFTRFKLLVMGSGLFEFLKGELGQVLAKLKKMEQDGSLKAFAKTLSTDIVSGLKSFAEFARAAGKVLFGLGKAVTWVADKVGGFENLLKIVAGFMVVKWVGSVLLFANSMFLLAGSVGITMATVSNAFILVGNVLKGIGALLLANPIFLAVALLATAAFLIYKNWEPIKAFFIDTWGKIKTAFAPAKAFFSDLWGGILEAFDKGFANGFMHLIETFDPVLMMLRLAKRIAVALTNALRGTLPTSLQGMADGLLGINEDGGVLQGSAATLTSSGSQPGAQQATVDVNVKVDSEGRAQVSNTQVRGAAAGVLDVDAGMAMGVA